MKQDRETPSLDPATLEALAAWQVKLIVYPKNCPCGICHNFGLEIAPDMAQAYVTDPLEFVAAAHKMTLRQYCEWVQFDGLPQCAATTKTGKPCRGRLLDAERMRENSAHFVARHRRDYCAAHSGPTRADMEGPRQ